MRRGNKFSSITHIQTESWWTATLRRKWTSEQVLGEHYQCTRTWLQPRKSEGDRQWLKDDLYFPGNVESGTPLEGGHRIYVTTESEAKVSDESRAWASPVQPEERWATAGQKNTERQSPLGSHERPAWRGKRQQERLSREHTKRITRKISSQHLLFTHPTTSASALSSLPLSGRALPLIQALGWTRRSL